jgi:hypothetical protein
MDWFFITRIGSISFHVMDLNFFNGFSMDWIVVVFQSIGLHQVTDKCFLKGLDQKRDYSIKHHSSGH